MNPIDDPTIEIIYFVFDTESDSDVSFAESLASLGRQAVDPDRVIISILKPPDVAIDESHHSLLGSYATRSQVIDVEEADYSQNKLSAMTGGTSDAVVFADSDVIYPDDWLERVEGWMARGAVALAGPPLFKKGSPLRLTLLLADFGLLWEQRHQAAPHINLHNFAIRREILDSLRPPEASYHRFGAPSHLARQLRSRELWITLDRDNTAVHGLNWRIWLGEKRMRRFAHAARMARTDPLADRIHAYSAHPTRPYTWVRLWWRWARRYQRRVGECAAPLDLNGRSRAAQRVLLAALSAWELVQILTLTIIRPLLHRMARRHHWW